MTIPYDPFFYPLLFMGILIYFGLKKLFSSENKCDSKNYSKQDHEEFMEWYRDFKMKNSPDYLRYQKWLSDHRQD